MNNTIPQITDPMGKSWQQPDASGIAIDDTHAVMTEGDWDALLAYDRSMPSGVYDGKMWRSLGYLVWISPGNMPDQCQVNYREALIV